MAEQTKEQKAAAAKAEADKKAKAAADAKAAREAEKEGKRAAAAREKEEAETKAREAKVKSGDLIVSGDVEFEAKPVATRSAEVVGEIIEELKGSKTPVQFAATVEKVGAKYPEDLQPAMHALESVGLVRRFVARDKGTVGRGATAYLWIGK